jgi:hypothetical protein
MQEICQKQIQLHTNPKEPRKAHSSVAEAGSQNKQSLKNIAETAGQDKTKSLSQDHCSRTWTNTNNPSRSTLPTKEKLEKKTKPISQDHHLNCRFSWSTKEESGTTCEP